VLSLKSGSTLSNRFTHMGQGHFQHLIEYDFYIKRTPLKLAHIKARRNHSTNLIYLNRLN